MRHRNHEVFRKVVHSVSNQITYGMGSTSTFKEGTYDSNDTKTYRMVTEEEEAAVHVEGEEHSMDQDMQNAPQKPACACAGCKKEEHGVAHSIFANS